MANQIVDRRTLVYAMDGVGSTVDLGGAGAGTLDTEIFIQGTGSVGNYVTNTLSGIMYNAGSPQNWSGNTFYIWINSGIVGLLATKAAGGMRIRFAGATVSNWFEVYVGGSDSYPTAVSGGWVQFVVNIDVARSTAITNGWTNGTVPATTAIQYVGYAAVTGGTMPRMADNTWIDEIRRLPANTAAVTVEGRNGGTTDWNWANIRTQLGVASGVVKNGPGGSYVLNGPIQFGFNDTSTHGFTDTSQVILWDNQEFIDDNLYALTARGNAGGTTNVTAGVKSGTGDNATGARGWIVQAASTGARWSIDFNDANVNSANLYGCTLIHGGTFALDSAAVSVISTQMADCTSASVANSQQLRNSIIAPNTATNIAFMTTDNIEDIVYCEFESGGTGHAIELTGSLVTPQTSKGNLFTGYALQGGTAGNRALYNNLGGALTINVTESGSVMSYRDGASASTAVQSTVNFSITGLKDNSEVRIYRTSDDVELYGEENTTGGTTTYQYNYVSDTPVYIHIHHIDYVFVRLELTLSNTDASVPVQQRFDRNYANP